MLGLVVPVAHIAPSQGSLADSGLAGVIATALVRDAHLQLGSARLGLGATGPQVRF